MADSWDFSGSAEWYDVILGKNEYEKNAKFVSQQLQKFNVKTVLELACGSGLYLFPLKKNGFNVEGLDISKEMLDVARKRSKTIKLYQQDMTKFNTKKKYDAILILNSGLALLPNHSLIDKTIPFFNPFVSIFTMSKYYINFSIWNFVFFMFLIEI